MKRFAAAIVLFFTLAVAAHAVVVSEEIAGRFAGRVLSPVEGVWLISDGPVLAIERGHARGGDFVITMLQSPNLAMKTPVVVGSMKEAAAGDYEMTIYTNTVNGHLTDRITFKTKLRADGKLAMSHKSQLPRVRLSAIFRNIGPVLGLSKTIEFKGIDYLAKRIFPRPAPSPENPVAL